MITLITGTPGAGKTAFTVGVEMLAAAKEGRLIYTMGIPDLKLPHLPVPPREEWTVLRESEEEQGLMLPYFDFPEGSLIVIDEAQRIFPARPNGSKVPQIVQAFETHRHTGVDFILLTQNPQLLDNNVRKLVGRHIHLRDAGFLGRWYYEWPEAADVAQYRTALVKKRYKLPKEAFDLYKSASLHIKPRRALPPVLVTAVLALMLCVILGGFTVYRLKNKSAEAKAKEPAAEMHAAEQSVPPKTPSIQTPDEVLLELVPVVADRPETAPIYASLKVAKDMPQVQGCVVYDDACSCYTQQGTKALVSETYCRAWMDGHRPFNPYREPQQIAAASETRTQRPQQVIRAPGAPPEWLQSSPVLPPADNRPSAPPPTMPQPMQGSPMESGLAGQPG